MRPAAPVGRASSGDGTSAPSPGSTVSAAIIVIRHPKTRLNTGSGLNSEKNSSEKVRGWLDEPLDQTGLSDARETARRVAVLHPMVIFTSDLQRASMEAHILSQLTGARVIPTSGLRTWNVGNLAGQPVSKVKKTLQRLTQDGTTPAPGGESHQAFTQRFLATFTHLAKQAKINNTPVAVVTHASPVRVLYSLLTRGTIDPKLSDGIAKAQDPIPPGGYVVLTPSGSSWKWGTVHGDHLKNTGGVSP